MFDTRLYNVLEFATRMHAGQRRDDGQPFITHPISVMMILSRYGFMSYNYMATALLHDTIEDTSATYEDVLELVGTFVANNVLLLTMESDQSHNDYYKALRKTTVAGNVKIADRIHNLDSMKNAWTRDKALRYIGYTENDFSSWAYRNRLGGELKRATEDAKAWVNAGDE